MNPQEQNHLSDRWTHNAKQAVDMLLLKDPVRTSLGLVLGGTLSFLRILLEPALRDIPFANFVDAPPWGWLALGTLIMHVPTVLHLWKRPSVGSHAMDMFFASIDRAGFSAAERRQLYRRLIERIVDVAVVDHIPQEEPDATPRDATD